MFFRRARLVRMLSPALLFLVLFAATTGRCSVTLLVEEPFGHFGGMNPTGHAAVYLNGVCAENPSRLRLCRPGEMGVVISRYHKVAGYDWLAIPIIPYLYAVETLEEIPATATEPVREKMRDTYRRSHLRALAPDAEDQGSPGGEWIQLVGSSYDRTIHGFTLPTTLEQDAKFIAEFNDRSNVSHFNLLFNNCADFSQSVLGFYYPHSTHRNFIADVGFTTPKQLARMLAKYDKKHPETSMTAFIIPQVPGPIERSRPVRGVLESLVKSKRYLIPLGYLQPELTGGMALAYLTAGRYRFPEDVPTLTASALIQLGAGGDLSPLPVPSVSGFDVQSVLSLSFPSEAETEISLSVIYVER